MTPGRMTSEGTAVQRHKATQTRARREREKGKTDGEAMVRRGVLYERARGGSGAQRGRRRLV